ncbi:MAG: hypothetical protein ABFE07_28830 [Armatimonadia bacterium]
MGTDIHVVFQKKDGENWVDIPHKYNEDRHYQLFAVLAGVRNGTGFAGCRIGDPVRPIAKPRGYPKDFVVEEECHPVTSLAVMSAWRQESHQKHPEWYKDEPLRIGMGYHDQSWLTGKEMLAWYKKAPVVTHFGYVERSVYDQWDGKSEPTEYCGGVDGPNIVKVNDVKAEMKRKPNWTHVACHWSQSLKKELSYFFKEVERLQKEHGEIRMVFGFDS